MTWIKLSPLLRLREAVDRFVDWEFWKESKMWAD
jgi:hypothetical protein